MTTILSTSIETSVSRRKLIFDNFAGGGGASTGIRNATGREVDHAINHAWDALGMHRINHPRTIHHCEDVFEIDLEEVCEGLPIGLAHFSPDCKHFSKAKGGTPLNKRVRGLVLLMLYYAKYGAEWYDDTTLDSRETHLKATLTGVALEKWFDQLDEDDKQAAFTRLKGQTLEVW